MNKAQNNNNNCDSRSNNTNINDNDNNINNNNYNNDDNKIPNNYNYIGCRLDRFYISAMFKNALIDCIMQPCTVSDHDFVNLTINADVGISFGKSYWKFNDTLLEDAQFKESFEYYWVIISQSNYKNLQWWDKMKTQIKYFCIDYSKQKNKEIYGEYRKLKKAYNNIDLNKNDNLQQQEEIKKKK